MFCLPVNNLQALHRFFAGHIRVTELLHILEQLHVGHEVQRELFDVLQGLHRFWQELGQRVVHGGDHFVALLGGGQFDLVHQVGYRLAHLNRNIKIFINTLQSVAAPCAIK